MKNLYVNYRHNSRHLAMNIVRRSWPTYDLNFPALDYKDVATPQSRMLFPNILALPVAYFQFAFSKNALKLGCHSSQVSNKTVRTVTYNA